MIKNLITRRLKIRSVLKNYYLGLEIMKVNKKDVSLGKSIFFIFMALGIILLKHLLESKLKYTKSTKRFVLKQFFDRTDPKSLFMYFHTVYTTLCWITT